MKNKELQLIKDLVYSELINNIEKTYELPANYEQRSIGDRYEGKCVEIIKNINNKLIINTKGRRSKKSLEDVTLITSNYKIYIDPKTVDVTPDLPTSEVKKFSMPNLTAIRKLKHEIFTTEDTEVLYISLKYLIEDNILKIQKIELFYVWELDLDYTRFGNLGRGQLQIKNARNEIKLNEYTRNEWWNKFVKKINDEYIPTLLKNYQKEIKFWQQK